MKKKLEQGSCITAVMTPNRGVTVIACGPYDDIRSTFGALCYEFLKHGWLSYEDMRYSLTAAVVMDATLHNP